MASHRNSVQSGARLRAFAALAALAAAGCDFNGDPLVIEPEFDDVSLFEVDLGKWTGRVVDPGTPPVTWEVARSADRAHEGTQSARIRLDNRAGQAKVILERRYEVEKNQAYAVAISFQLASVDGVGVTPWRVLAGAATTSPVTAGTVNAPGETGNGRAADQGYVWLPKTYSMDVTSNDKGELFVYAGVWATAEAVRTYYVDELKVSLTRKGLSKAP